MNLLWHFDMTNSVLANFLFTELAKEITLRNITLVGENSEEVIIM